MKVTVIGTGYVGLVSGACLADMGNDVVCLDVDATKLALLQSGGMPIYEPGLDAVVARNVAAGRKGARRAHLVEIADHEDVREIEPARLNPDHNLTGTG